MIDIKTKIFTILIGVSFIYSMFIPQPQGTSISSPVYNVGDDEVEFLYDLTFDKYGKRETYQSIFERAYYIIDQAEDFIIVDVFLFNDEYDKKDLYPNLAYTLSQKLIDKKKNNPEIEIVVITDEINTFYGSYEAKVLEMLKNEGIDVVFTKIEKMRDSNHIYSGFWRMFLNWGSGKGNGWLSNPFSQDSPKVTIRSYMRLLNFKANHRKVLVSDKEALISSANPHDASAFHSNIAFSVRGPIIGDIVSAEKVIASWAGLDIGFGYRDSGEKKNDVTEKEIKLQYITEGSIGSEVTDAVKNTKNGDEINIAMFYLSDRKLINEIIRASNRGVEVNMILDANKDAFGRQKNGIPNRVVAHEIFEKTNKKAQIKWYKTSGEQFHTKLISVRSNGVNTIFGGSANMTKRNIRGYNLESDVKIVAPQGSNIGIQIEEYFDMLNHDKENKLLEYESYAQKSIIKKLIYRFQEWSGLCTF